MSATMKVVESTDSQQNVYLGASPVVLSGPLPSYRGGVTMTIQFDSSQVPQEPSKSGITVDKDVHCGIPCIGVGNWPIAHLLKKLASGFTCESLLRDYQGLRRSDVETALEAAAWTMADTSIDWNDRDLSEMLELQDELKEWQTLTDAAFLQSELLFEDR